MNSKEIEEAVEEYDLAPESEADRLECIYKLEAAEPDPDNVQENVPDYSRQANAVTEARATREPPSWILWSHVTCTGKNWNPGLILW
ncbi:uncharacterized protein AKAME5_002412600 [Lates japonicus]|uniref:Uncharacterized protein n=1 Tax=Lates japonicus TaxID=270547 RepID=A0AAD3NKN8_LATJO|nr:uncharacterized protein AKAME5_002412600 [Lates japonicus]